MVHPSSQTLDFSFNFLTTLHQTVFPTLSYLHTLDLTRCHIQVITDNAFYNVRNVTSLILTGNPIKIIGPKAFNSLPGVHRLVLVDIGLRSLEDLSICHLTKLQQLNIGTNNIRSMSIPLCAINFTNFWLLDLHANRITIIRAHHTTTLSKMSKKITLILSRNPILMIEPGAFQKLHLQELNLRDTFPSLNITKNNLKALGELRVRKIVLGRYKESFRTSTSDLHFLDGLCTINFEEIYYYQRESVPHPHEVFGCMLNATQITLVNGAVGNMAHIQFRRIKELNLIGSNVDSIPDLQLSHQHTLERLVITANGPLGFLNGFEDLPHLQYIDLSNNRMAFKRCCKRYFRGTPQLRYINMSINSVIRFEYMPFSGLESLEVLDFHHTRLYDIVDYPSMTSLTCLQYLDISYTGMTFKNPLSLLGLISLRVLKMSNNKFQGDTFNFMFMNLTELETLDISTCGIEGLQWDTFDRLWQLKHLILNGNKLMTLDFLTNPSLAGLTWVDMRENHISTVVYNTLQNLPNNLSALDLSYNPIDCSCSNIDFITWIINHKNMLKHSHNILCKTLSLSSDKPVMNFDTNHCLHIWRVNIIMGTVVVVVLLAVPVLAYKFQFYLHYCCILLRCYKVSQNKEYCYDAFVIYSNKDEMWVMEELVENLERRSPSIQLCLHVRDFEIGEPIASNVINEGIMKSRKVIVVVSQHFIDSTWCRFEFEVAQSWLLLEGNPNIIIVILEELEEKRTEKVFGLHKYLKRNSYLKWRDNPISKMRFWIRLRKAVIA